MDIAQFKKLNSTGQTSDIFEVDDKKILKLYRQGWPREFAYREYMNNKIVNDLNFLAPEAFEFIEIDNRYGYIMEKLIDNTLADELEKNPLKLAKISHKLAELHACLHTHTNTQMIDQKKQYEKVFINSTVFSQDEKKKLINTLNEISNKSENKICHGDFHPRNILFNKDNYYTIDWLGATVGNPCADVAWTYLVISEVGSKEGGSKWFESYVRSIAQKYLKRYISITGRSKDEIFQWIPIMAARSYIHANKAFSKEINQTLYKIAIGEMVL